MKFYCLLIILCLPFTLLATEWTTEVRGAGYRLSSKQVKNIYAENWTDYQVEASQRLCRYFDFWVGVNWASKRSRLHRDDYYLYSRERTQIFVLPLSAGYKFIYPLCNCLDFYLGGGICYTFLKIRNGSIDSTCGPERGESFYKKWIKKDDVGGVAKLGIRWSMGSDTFLDVFVDYFSQRFRLSRSEALTMCSCRIRHLNCSGLKYGLGFGVYF
ncbi:MAG: hypothetical protein H0V82_03935 [Candidatus Protochlamydia sp.]|nr:hypothetical protein [Candidatus Protochlamydia sp.]